MDNILRYILFYSTYLIYLILLIIILIFIFSASLKMYHSRWNTLLDGFNFSTLEFYTLLKEELHNQGISRIEIKNVSLKEGNAFSAKRTYLRASWKDYQYDICAAPFGKGFFVSWWLLYKSSLGQIIVSKIPFIGGWLARKLYPVTYYKIDTASMFMSYAQSSVLKVIDDITNNKGVRALTETEKKPILNDIFIR